MANTTSEIDLNFYGYNPNEPAAIVAAVLFGILGMIMIILNIRFKTWFLMAIPIGSFMEVIGFALRPSSSYDLGKYIVAILCVLLSPTVFAVADYSLIGKIMMKTEIHHPIFKPQRVRWIFLFADIASFFIQCMGGSMTASHDLKVAENGSKIVLGGLCVALCVFVFFLFLLTYVYKVLVTKDVYVTEEGKNVKAILFILLTDMILLIIRSAYRVAEFGDLTYHNSISTNEGLFYGLDAIEMLLLNALWIPFHPGFWGMTEDHSNETTKTQKTSVAAPEETELTPRSPDDSAKETKVSVED